MANDGPPEKPKERNERREQENRIAAISDRIAEISPQLSAAIRELVGQFAALVKQIQADSATTETREKEHHNRSVRWVIIGTLSSILISLASVGTAIIALRISSHQLNTMRLEQRAWVKVEHKLQPTAENKPLVADIVIKNTGKTPAKHIAANFRVQIVRKTDSPEMESGFNFHHVSGILHPDTSLTNNVPMMRETQSITNPTLLTKADLAKVESGEAYIAVFGRVTYSDVYGVSHWVNFCDWGYFKPGPYNALACVGFNDVDNN